MTHVSIPQAWVNNVCGRLAGSGGSPLPLPTHTPRAAGCDALTERLPTGRTGRHSGAPPLRRPAATPSVGRAHAHLFPSQSSLLEPLRSHLAANRADIDEGACHRCGSRTRRIRWCGAHHHRYLHCPLVRWGFGIRNSQPLGDELRGCCITQISVCRRSSLLGRRQRRRRTPSRLSSQRHVGASINVAALLMRYRN